ncbi:MAG: hypothetical protein JXA74_15355 [Anaerolineae bacterium]|nr:hypothetical protein [Anaerolineae bacterium]
MVLLIALLASASAASAKSLPGDLLYGVKRASEGVRMLLTTDAESRAALQQELEMRRVTEVQQVVEQKREVRVEFGGLVEKVEEDTITVQGIPVRVATLSTADKMPPVGARVQVVAQTEPTGQITAESLQIQAEPPAVAATPPPSRSELGLADRRPTTTPLPLPKSTPTGVPSFTPPPATSSATPIVANTLVVSPTIGATHTATGTPSLTLEPSATEPQPTATGKPAPRDVMVRIEGRIDAIAGSQWTIAGQRISLEGSTRILQDQARAEIGGRAVVQALRRPDGTLVAREIEVVQGPTAEPRRIEFSGPIESIAPESWSVAGREVTIPSSTMIDGTPTVGARAGIKADEYPDGRLVAHEITVEAPAEQPVAFAGVIEAIHSGSWVVAGQRVFIGPETQIAGDPEIGAIAEVSAIVRSDGTTLASRINVRALPEATSEQSVDWQATQQPTDTALPPTEAPPTQTPIAPTATASAIVPTLTPSETMTPPPLSETPTPEITTTPSAKPPAPTATASRTPTPSDETTQPTATSEAIEAEGIPTVDQANPECLDFGGQ